MLLQLLLFDNCCLRREESVSVWLKMSRKHPNNIRLLSAVSLTHISDNCFVVFSKKDPVFFSPLFGLCVSLLYVIKLCELSGFILLVQDQKSQMFFCRAPCHVPHCILSIKAVGTE